MATDSVKLEIIVDDKGSLVIKNFKDVVGKSMGEVSGQSAVAGSSISGMWQSIMTGQIAAQVATKFLSGLIGIVNSATDEFLNADKIQRQFEATLNNVGLASEKNIKVFDGFATQIQEITIVDDEAVKSVMGLGLRMGISGDQIRDATLDAIGLSKAFGVDLNSAMMMVVQATEGNFRGMQQYLPVLKNTEDTSEKMAIAQQAMAAGLRLAQTETQGLAGEMAQAENKINDTKEKIGELGAEFKALTYKALSPCVETLLAFIETLRRVDERQIKDTTTKQFMENKAAFEAAAKAAGVLDQAQKDLFAEHGNISASQAGMEIYGNALDDLIAKYPKAAAGFNEYFKAQQGVDLQNKKITISTDTVAAAQKKATAAAEALKIKNWELDQATKAYKESLPGLNQLLANLKTSEFEIASTFKLSTVATDANTFSLNQNKVAQFNLSGASWSAAAATKETTDKIKEASAATEKWTIDWKDANDVLAASQQMMSVVRQGLADIGVELGPQAQAFMDAADGATVFIDGLTKGNPLTMIAGAIKVVTGLIKAFAGDGVGEAIKRENQWMNLTKEQIKQLRELEKQYGSTHAATSDMLDQLINNADVTTRSFDKWAIRLRGILSDYDQGKMTLSQTTKQMGDAFTALIGKAKELGTEGSKSLINMFEDLANRGMKVKEVMEYIDAQMASGLAGYKKMKAATLENADALAAFGGMGIKVFDDIIAYEEKIAANRGLVDGIEGATAALTGLSNAQKLTEDQFDQFATAGDIAYQKLLAGGMTSTEALNTMGPYLQRLQFLHEQYGYTIDETTQKMIDQAIVDGIVTENKKTETRQMIDLLGSIAKALGADIPGALDETAKAATDAFGTASKAAGQMGNAIDHAMRDRVVNLKISDIGDIPGGGWNGGQNIPIYAASGWQGIVAGGSNTRFVTGEDGPEYVNITPLSKIGSGWASPRAGTDSKQTIIIEDHSVWHIQVDPKSGIDQNALCEGINVVVKNNRQQVADNIAAAVARKL